MDDLIRELKSVIAAAVPRLFAVSEEDARIAPAGKWCKKEILGHLIDSACNNHQRFVRSQLQPEVSFPAYQQDSWVDIQKYVKEAWPELVRFWEDYNRHLIHLISQTPGSALEHRCSVGEATPVTLEFLMRDYLRHLRHHLAQILEK